MADTKHPEPLRERNRADNIAQTLVQIALAVLPIAAGASGLLSQDHNSFESLIMVGIIWIGMLLIAVSIFLNLHVLRLPDPTNQAGWISIKNKYNSAILVFILGTLSLVTAPVELLIPNLNASPPETAIHFEPKALTFLVTKDTTQQQSVILVIENKDKVSQVFQINFRVSPSQCLILNPSTLNETIAGKSTKLIELSVTANSGCLNQYYVILGEISQRNAVLDSNILSVTFKQ